MIEMLFSRIFAITGCRSDAELARALGISRASIREARHNQTVPDQWLETLRNNYRVNPEWLKHGSEPVFVIEEEEPQFMLRTPAMRALAQARGLSPTSGWMNGSRMVASWNNQTSGPEHARMPDAISEPAAEQTAAGPAPEQAAGSENSLKQDNAADQSTGPNLTASEEPAMDGKRAASPAPESVNIQAGVPITDYIPGQPPGQITIVEPVKKPAPEDRPEPSEATIIRGVLRCIPTEKLAVEIVRRFGRLPPDHPDE